MTSHSPGDFLHGGGTLTVPAWLLLSFVSDMSGEGSFVAWIGNRGFKLTARDLAGADIAGLQYVVGQQKRAHPQAYTEPC
ncbi:poly-beta-hydroxybutyrate polymerase [Marssonina coronariae]|uniref:Poly-beta-hydroxybutyrate polymerase n=1 Tax=Diplocarpon coronariae TaxID=2795749 RepID=A0A218ZEF0_9HELO|nr:poly-beta-hydroxybutyrate polymerase [Marssonina coronariae]